MSIIINLYSVFLDFQLFTSKNEAKGTARKKKPQTT